MSDNSFVERTAAYQQWLGGIIDLNSEELDQKRERIKADPFEFLRGTFYRWAEIWREQAPVLGLEEAPHVLGVGDLHVENFGTWRDVDGRLAWGVNDFDEACCLPYVNDLVRLAVSAEVAVESEGNSVNFDSTVTKTGACDAILTGYTEGMEKAAENGRRPTVLAEGNAWLRTVVVNKLEKKDKNGKTKFDKIVHELSGNGLADLQFEVPPEAREALLHGISAASSRLQV